MKLKTIRKINDETELNITGATLLSIEEVVALPYYLRAYKNWWWLRSPGRQSYNAVLVNKGGRIYGYGYPVGIDDDAVRPVLQISNLEPTNLKIGDSIFFGEKEFEIISDELAFCKTDIGICCFREDCEAEDANDYEKSDIKKFVDKWFERALKENESGKTE